jgi:hypothetical protein
MEGRSEGYEGKLFEGGTGLLIRAIALSNSDRE